MTEIDSTTSDNDARPDTPELSRQESKHTDPDLKAGRKEKDVEKPSSSEASSHGIPKTIKLKRSQYENIANQSLREKTASTQLKNDTTLIESASPIMQDGESATHEDTHQKTAVERKKDTSRIRLEDVGVAGKIGDEPRLAPKDSDEKSENLIGVPSTIQLKRPAAIKPDISADDTQIALSQDTDRIGLSELPTISRNITSKAKATTSRIILDDIVTLKTPGDEKQKTSPIDAIVTSSSSVPKTIKLKRPSSAVVTERATVVKTGAEKTLDITKKSETSKINLPKEEEIAPVPITQRKTIRIKRTKQNVVPQSVTLRHPGAEVTEEVDEEVIPSEVEIPKEDVGLFYSVVAVAAILIAAVLVYIMVAQAFGPQLILPVPSQLL